MIRPLTRAPRRTGEARHPDRIQHRPKLRALGRGAGPPSPRPRAAAPSHRRRGAPYSSILPDCVRSLRPANERPPFCVLMARLATRTCGVLVGAGDGAVHAHLPLYLAHCIRFGLRVGQQAIPNAVTPPTHETVVTSLP